MRLAIRRMVGFPWFLTMGRGTGRDSSIFVWLRLDRRDDGAGAKDLHLGRGPGQVDLREALPGKDGGRPVVFQPIKHITKTLINNHQTITHFIPLIPNNNNNIETKPIKLQTKNKHVKP